MSTAPQSQSQQYYNVLLMITDGEINDMVNAHATSQEKDRPSWSITRRFGCSGSERVGDVVCVVVLQEATIASVVSASSLPLSVIIVGVGEVRDW